jgi:hypothetical protein
MSNDQLVCRLVRDQEQVRRRSVAGDALVLLLLCVVEFYLCFGTGAMRHNMPMAMGQPPFWWKIGSLGLVALIGGWATIVSLETVESPCQGLRWLVGVVALCLAVDWVTGTRCGGLSALATRPNWSGGLLCACKMMLLSVPAVIGFGLLMWSGRPTETTVTALADGIAAAAWVAFVFAFACPYNGSPYIAMLNAVGCGLVTVFARLVLSRLTRW